MIINVVGVNHTKAPVELREKLAFDERSLAPALRALREGAGSAEEVILSTCNRVELYFVHEAPDADPLGSAARFLSGHHRQPVETIRPILYRYEGSDAVRHLFQVASSLDSMVLGETQIIAQVKQAYLAAKEAGHTGRFLNPLFQRALAVAKRVHTTTGIGERSVSVPSVAAKLAQKIFQDLAGRRILILGAGETGTLTLEALRERGARDVTVLNRTVETARALAERFAGNGFGLDRLDAELPRADIVVACLSAPEPVVREEHVRAAVHARRGEPVLMIDIAVPRNIEASVNGIENVYLFNVDDLEGIVNQNLLERKRGVDQCAPVLDAETTEAMRDIATSDVRGVLASLRSSYEAVGEDELRRVLAKLSSLPPDQRAEIELLVHRIIGKLLHNPITSLKEEAHNGSLPHLLDLVTRLFKLK